MKKVFWVFWGMLSLSAPTFALTDGAKTYLEKLRESSKNVDYEQKGKEAKPVKAEQDLIKQKSTPAEDTGRIPTQGAVEKKAQWPRTLFNLSQGRGKPGIQ